VRGDVIGVLQRRRLVWWMHVICKCISFLNLMGSWSRLTCTRARSCRLTQVWVEGRKGEGERERDMGGGVKM
jgi:hypothetical protein